jgi:hypothetical protein
MGAATGAFTSAVAFLVVVAVASLVVTFSDFFLLGDDGADGTAVVFAVASLVAVSGFF